jgi:hypothetical protein
MFSHEDTAIWADYNPAVNSGSSISDAITAMDLLSHTKSNEKEWADFTRDKVGRRAKPHSIIRAMGNLYSISTC